MVDLVLNATENLTDKISVNMTSPSMATSAVGDCLLPYPTIEPLEDDALIDFIQPWVSCLTGVPGNLIRPRWQVEPPNIPKENIDWLAIGIVHQETDLYPAEIHHPDGAGYTEFRTHQRLTVIASFYGPNAGKYAGRLRDGMKIGQNRWDLLNQGMDVMEVTDISVVPEFIKEKWLRRCDLPFTLVRQIVRTYPILNLLSSQFNIDNENYIEITTAGA